VIPCLEKLVLEGDLGDLFDVGRIKQVSHGAICSREVTNRIHHLLVILSDPVRGSDVFIGDRGETELDNDVPTDLVAWDGECCPLKIVKKTTEFR